VSEPVGRLAHRGAPLIALSILISLVALAGATGSAAFEQRVIHTLTLMVAVVGLYVFVGNSGVVSFGHIAFMALGAYVTAWLTIPTRLKEVLLPELPGFLAQVHTSAALAVPVSAAVAGVFALALSIPLMRLSGVAAAIATLSVLVVVNIVLSSWDALTSGTGTLVGIPTSDRVWETLPWVLLCAAGAFAYQESRFGRRLRATREDSVAAASVGISLHKERGVAFVLSAVVVGAAGSLFAQYIGSINPSAFYIDLTVLTLAMLVIGGITSLSGAVVGTLVLAAVSEFLTRVQEDGVTIAGLDIESRAGLREMVIAALMITVLILRPRGLTGGVELTWPRLGRSRSTPNA
jgi:branched-chain amino acid transport system permease protein